MKDYYAVLGVAPDADADVIAAAFKAMSKKYHPDRKPQEQRAACEKKQQEIGEAWAVLRDPEKRQRYDRQRQGDPERQRPVDRQQRPIDLEDVAGTVGKIRERLGRGIQAAKKGEELLDAIERIWSK